MEIIYSNEKFEFITPKVKVIDFNKIIDKDIHSTNYTHAAKVMEYVCRVCYNSYDKMTPDSYVDILSGAAKKDHRSVFEFCNIEMMFSLDKENFNNIYYILSLQKYFNIDINFNSYIIKVSGSLKSYIEFLENIIVNNLDCNFLYLKVYRWLNDKFKYIMQNLSSADILYSYYGYCSNTCKIYDNINKFKINDITIENNLKKDKKHRKVLVELVTDKGVHNEMVRHRPCSHLAESQRYVRYGDGKNPFIVCVDSKRINDEKYLQRLKESCVNSFNSYLELLKLDGISPQLARAVLPVGTAMKSFVYCNIEEWEHIFRLRCHYAALPMMQEVTKEILQQFINKGLY